MDSETPPTGSVPPHPPQAPFQYWVPPLGGVPPAAGSAPGPDAVRRVVRTPAAAPSPGVAAKRKRPHRARKSRIAAAVISTGAFVGLVGCAALSDGGQTGSADPSPAPAANAPQQSSQAPPQYDQGQSFGSSDGGASDSTYDPGQDFQAPQQYDQGQNFQGQGSSQGFGSGSAVPGNSNSSGPSTSSRGS